MVDWEAPEISLAADLAHDRLVVSARDVISADRLEFAYRVGQGDTSAFGPSREISLSAIEQQGGVTVLARDEFGNVGQAIYRSATVALREDPAVDAPAKAAGCSTTGGLLALGALALIRRRRRA
jgi:hypothetical protein